METAGNAVEASQTVGAATATETSGSAQIAKEGVEHAVEASQIVGAAKASETPWAAQVIVRITVEAANEPADNVEAVVERLIGDIFKSEEAAEWDPEPEVLNKIFEVEEAAQIDPEPEHLNEKFEFKEAAQIEPEQEQLNNSFLESKKKQILPRLTLYRFTL